MEASTQVDEAYGPAVRLAVVLHFFRETRTTADFDNLAKSVTDPLNGLAWHDDNQIDEAHIYVHRGVGKGNGRATVRIGRVGRVMRSPGLRRELEAAHVRRMAAACRTRAAVHTLPTRERKRKVA